MILGSGPNRIGQGIEFDYCCCHASFALREDGYETIMVNCNPETVSTDYDTSDRLYFEPLTLEDVLAVVEREKPHGVIVQFGGQTPLNLALELKRNGVPIIGTAPESIDLAEDRRRFGRLLDELRIPQPRNGTALIPEEAARVAGEIGLPVLVRPSYVLGGRAMVIAYDVNTVQEYVAQAALMGPARPVLIDQFLEEATEVDVDALCDGTDVVIGGIMEHIEEAGVHSGDSSCVLPPVSLSPRNSRHDSRIHQAAGAGAESRRTDERAVCDSARHGVCAGSESARVAHRAVCEQGDWRAAGESCGAIDGREETCDHEVAAGRAQRRLGNRRARILFREVAGFPVQQVSRRGHHPRAGNALDRRSDGHFDFVRAGVRQSAAGGRATLAAQRHSFLSVNDRDKKHVGPLGKELQALGFKLAGHARNGCGAGRCGNRSGGGFQSKRGPAQHRGPGEDRRRSI